MKAGDEANPKMNFLACTTNNSKVINEQVKFWPKMVFLAILGQRSHHTHT